MEVRLYHAISGQGIEQLRALFGSVFPLFLVKLAWGGVEFPAFGLAVGVGRGGGDGEFPAFGLSGSPSSNCHFNLLLGLKLKS